MEATQSTKSLSIVLQPVLTSTTVRDSPHLHAKILQKDHRSQLDSSGINTQQSSQQPLLSLSQIDN